MVDAAPICTIRSAEPVPLPVYELSPDADSADMVRILRKERSQAIDLTDGPLIRFALVRVHQNEHWLLRVCHHILWDAWSSNVFLDELMVLYEAKLRKETPPSSDSMRLQFADYAAWQRRTFRKDGAIYKEVLAWWKKRPKRDHPPIFRSSVRGQLKASALLPA